MTKKTILILLDNRNGSRHQAEGIAAYLSDQEFDIIYQSLEYTKYAALPNFIRGSTLLGLTKESKEHIKKLPASDIVLSSTRRTAPIARYIKKSAPQTKLVQLGHIGHTGIKEFSLLIIPEHDKNKFTTPNMRYTIGCPHFITKEKLIAAEKQWEPLFAALPHPRTALIIGGAIKKRPFSLQNAKDLAIAARLLKEKEGGSLLITTSRRTGANAEKEINSILSDIPQYAYFWNSKDENPYLGFLACSDNIIVTGDSVSMCSEATATRKPLRIFTGKNWLTPKHYRFARALYEKGYAAELNTKEITECPIPDTSLNEAQNAARFIAEL